MDASETIARSVRAEKLLTDPLLSESWEKVRTALLAKIETSPARDTEGRERLYFMLKALNDVRGCLEQVVNNGKVVIHLEEEKRRLSLFKR